MTPDWLDVRDFGNDINAAIRQCLAEGGGRVYAPRQTYELQSGLIFPRDPVPAIPVLSPAVELFGDGINVTTVYTNEPDVDLVTIARSNVTIRRMLLQGARSADSTGRGVVISDPINGSVLHGVRLEDVYIAATGGSALCVPDGYPHLLNQPAFDRIAVGCSYDRVTFDSNLGAGDLVTIGRCNTLHRFTQCHFTNFKARALFLNGADTTTLRDCAFENGDSTKPWIQGIGAAATLIDHAYFEDHVGNAVFTKHDRASTGWAEPNCTFRTRTV